MRLAAGQVWPVVANHSHDPGKDVGRQGSRESKPGHAGHAADEKDRHQGPTAGVRPRLTRRAARSVARNCFIRATSRALAESSSAAPRRWQGPPHRGPGVMLRGFLPPLPAAVRLVTLSRATARDSDNRCRPAPSRPRRIAMRIVIRRSARLSVGAGLVAVGLVGAVRAVAPAGNALSAGVLWGFDKVIEDNANLMVREGRETFRFDTFGDEAFWGDALQLHRAIAGSPNGGIGPGVSPKTALAVGLKVDVDALPETLRQQLREGKVNLDDPATTLALLKLNAVVGVTGFFDASGNIRSIGIQCALCHSTVNNSFAPGIGQRLDGWPARDLNVGAVVSLAPNLKPFADLLGVDVETVKKVFASWGPGRFDAWRDKDVKAFRPDGQQAGPPNPPAFGSAGVNLHTWTGSGSVTYWNAYVGATEMHGSGTFFDARLNRRDQYPVAARSRSGNTRRTPDRLNSKLAALPFSQLAIPAPKPPAGPF